MLWLWSDELVWQHTERTAALMAGGLSRSQAAERAYRELRPAVEPRRRAP